MAEIEGHLEKPKILVVDDNPQNLDVLIGGLEDFDISVALGGQEALELAREIEPDLILLDVMMPGMDGFETCEALKKDGRTNETPVIFLTALADTESKLRAFSVGGVDYISKPLRLEEVLARMNAHLTIRAQQRALERKNIELELKNQKILEQARQLEELARTDPLTGLSNRRDFLDRANVEQSRFERGGNPFSIILCDIDHFKKFNDVHGHDCGDEVLKRTANTIVSAIREQDIAARWGGEEFIVLLPDTDLEGGKAAAEKIRAKIEASKVGWKGEALSVTLTLGVSLHDGVRKIAKSIKMADEALYEGKEAGRNRVIAAG